MPDESDPSGWTAFAAEYIRFVDEGDPSRTMLLDDVMLDECGNVDGQLILDIGAGEGRFSRMLAERGARTIALDLFWPMVRAARHRSAGQGAIVRSPATALPIASATVDTVVSYVVWVDMCPISIRHRRSRPRPQARRTPRRRQPRLHHRLPRLGARPRRPPPFPPHRSIRRRAPHHP